MSQLPAQPRPTGNPANGAGGAAQGGNNSGLLQVFDMLPTYFSQVEKGLMGVQTLLSLRQLVLAHSKSIDAHFSSKGLPSPMAKLPDLLNPTKPLTGKYAEQAAQQAAAQQAAQAQAQGGQAGVKAGSGGSGTSTPGSVGPAGGVVRPGVGSGGQQVIARPGPPPPGARPTMPTQPQPAGFAGGMKLFPPAPGSAPRTSASPKPNPPMQNQNTAARPTLSLNVSQGSVPQTTGQGGVRPVLPQAQAQAQGQGERKPSLPGPGPTPSARPPGTASTNPTLPPPPRPIPTTAIGSTPAPTMATPAQTQTQISMQMAPGGKYTWGEISQMSVAERERWFVEEPNGRAELNRILAEIRLSREAAARLNAKAAATGNTDAANPSSTTATTANTSLTTNNLAGVTKTPAGVRDPNAGVASYLASLPVAVPNLTLPSKGAGVSAGGAGAGAAGGAGVGAGAGASTSTGNVHRLQVNIAPESQFHFLTTLKTIPSFPNSQTLDEKGVYFFLRLNPAQCKQLSNTHREIREWLVRSVQRKSREDELRRQDFKVPQTPGGAGTGSGAYGLGAPITNRSTIQNIVMEIQRYKEKEPRGISLDTVKEMCRRAGVTFTMELEKAVEPLCVRVGGGPVGAEEWMEGNVREMVEDVLGERLPSYMEKTLISLTSARFDGMLDSACRFAKAKKKDEVPNFKDLSFALRNDYRINTHAYASEYSTFNLKRKAAEAANEREAAKKARTNVGSAVTATTGVMGG